MGMLLHRRYSAQATEKQDESLDMQQEHDDKKEEFVAEKKPGRPKKT